MVLGLIVAEALAATLAIGLGVWAVLRHRRQVLTDRDQAVWRELFRSKGGSSKRFDGYDESRAVAALKAEQARFRRRYGRHKTIQRGSGDRAKVISIATRKAAER